MFLLSCIGWLSQTDWNSQVEPQLAREGISTWKPTGGRLRYKECDLHEFLGLCCRSGWRCLSPVCRVCASLGRRLPNRLDAVLLELSSKQSILILQLFDLRNKGGQEVINIFIPATVTHSSELTEQSLSVAGIIEWYVQPCVKTPCPQPTGLSNLVVCHLCYISPEWILSSLPPTPTEGDVDYVNNNILLSALRALDSMGRNGSLGAVRLHSTSECISMLLALTQPRCILFPQSL